MILNILAQYKDVIEDYEILKFRTVGSAYQFICKISFVDQSNLFIKDYLFMDCSRKYSFHWQDKENELIIRWDNAPHHQGVKTFPYHKHVNDENNICESSPVKLSDVLEYIRQKIFFRSDA